MTQVLGRYGGYPEFIGLGDFDLVWSEVFYYLYLPVSLDGMRSYKIPRTLWPLRSLLDAVRDDIGLKAFKENNIYVTAKRMYVGGGISANRPGWHSDGFMTDDLNYIWYDCLPTVFNVSAFAITPDHIISLQEFEAQADPRNDIRFKPKNLLKLDERVIHRVDTSDKQIMRTFIKISVSKDKYNLKGNSINHDIRYNWLMHDRADIRNDPVAAQLDFKP